MFPWRLSGSRVHWAARPSRPENLTESTYCFRRRIHYVLVIRRVMDSERVDINRDDLSPKKVSTSTERF